MPLPTEAKARKEIPLFTGLIKYFPDALAEVAAVSYTGNQQHNPGQPLHWAREKSNDHEDCAARHLFGVGELDNDGQRHAAKLVWRALAILQLEIESSPAASGRSLDDGWTDPGARAPNSPSDSYNARENLKGSGR